MISYQGLVRTFPIDIDKKYPVITLISANGSICEADLDLEKARGAAWVGDGFVE
ncbi:hypothetical protein HV074_19300 [Citrobacter freundii]|uniref:hypothetical protein n=1 Tax=Citrobacter freundii TaxID=546 RepID=UPI0015E54CC6|nr:hypothetical protein [Citrobacter freundii]QLN64871.1 hypothetical protein HV074_19300 [Citrobacter freundii]QLO74068.1 hypothetical protein HV304_19005 [Citrobacter freundii]